MCHVTTAVFVVALSSVIVSSDGSGVVHSFVVRLFGKSDHLEERLPQCGEKPHDCTELDAATFLFQENLLLSGKSQCVTNTFRLSDKELRIQGSSPRSTFEQVVRNFCRKSPELLQCFQEADRSAASCVCGVVTDIDSPSLSTLSKFVDVLCSQEGEKLTRILTYSGEEFWTQTQQKLRKCMQIMKQQAGVLNLNKKLIAPNNLPRVLLKNYKRNRNFKQCVLTGSKPPDDLVDLIASFMDVILEDLRCFKKKSSTLASCSEVVRGGSQSARATLQNSVELTTFWLVLTCITSAQEINIFSLR